MKQEEETAEVSSSKPNAIEGDGSILNGDEDRVLTGDSSLVWKYRQMPDRENQCQLGKTSLC